MRFNWRDDNNSTKVLSFGDGLITAKVFYDGCAGKDATDRWTYITNKTYYGRTHFAREAEAMAACEAELTTRITKMCRQLGIPVSDPSSKA